MENSCGYLGVLLCIKPLVCSRSIWKKQVGGKHYTKYKIQPSKFVTENKLLYPEGCVIKNILRHPDKGGKQDLLKAIHYCEMIIERDYS